MKGKILVLLAYLTTLILPVLPAKQVFADTSTASTIVISEIKLGGDSYSQGIDQPKDAQEFVTLYNRSTNTINLDGWVLEYAKINFDKSYCNDSNWITHSISGSASQTTLSGTLQPGEVSTPISRPLTDNAAGSLHIINTSDKNNLIVEDLVGWGVNASCAETATTVTPSNGKSIKRYLDCNNLPIVSNNNAQDFANNQPPSPGTLNNPYLNTCQQEEIPTEPTPQLTCEGALINEILPNPTGSDAASEFIELYNPTSSALSLQGCSLQTTGSSMIFNFANVSLQPGEYRAFYGSDMGLTLPNAAGGTVWLLSPNTELQAVTYQANLEDNVAWIFINNSWHASYQATPNNINVLLDSKPCPDGEERNLDTGYCHTLATLSTSSLGNCKEGQERNPETNRCRTISSVSSSKSTSVKSSSTLTPCKAGQERNPATNRCKAVVTTASATLKSCPAGQERNPSTNRCKKIKSSTTSKLANVKDVATGSITSNPHWWLAGFAAFGATSYGVYEWRQEVLQFLSKIKTKIPTISSK